MITCRANVRYKKNFSVKKNEYLLRGSIVEYKEEKEKGREEGNKHPDPPVRFVSIIYFLTRFVPPSPPLANPMLPLPLSEVEFSSAFTFLLILSCNSP